MAKKSLKPALKNAGVVGSVKELKKSLKSRGGGSYLSRIPADGREVRFLTEPDQWLKYYEHYDASREDNRYYPCTEDCVGCDEGVRASKRYLANALDLTENKVIPQVLPSTLVTNLLKKYDKFGTMMDRDYELTKDGQGLDTDYDALYDQPKKMDLKRFELLDLEAVLMSQLSDTDDDDDDDDEPAKKSKGGKKSKKDDPPWDEDDDDDDDDEDEAPVRVKKKSPTGKTPVKKTLGKKKK